jgi:hypothetical protein
MEAEVKLIGKVFDVLVALVLFVLMMHALVQGLRDAPVEPSWSWAFWAYMAALRWSVRGIVEWADE